MIIKSKISVPKTAFVRLSNWPSMTYPKNTPENVRARIISMRN
jgi:hypothetical protein